MLQLPTRRRLPAASGKFGSMSQNISMQRAKIIQLASQIIFDFERLKSRDSRMQNGINQWLMKFSEQMTHQPPRMRARYHGISSGMLPDQMIKNSANVR